MTTLPTCPECGAKADPPIEVDAGYVKTLREAATWLERQQSATPEEHRAVGFLQGLVQIRQARLPVFVHQ